MAAHEIEEGLLALPERALVIQRGLRGLAQTADEVKGEADTAVTPPKEDFGTAWLEFAAKFRGIFPQDYEIPRHPETPAGSSE